MFRPVHCGVWWQCHRAALAVVLKCLWTDSATDGLKRHRQCHRALDPPRLFTVGTYWIACGLQSGEPLLRPGCWLVWLKYNPQWENKATNQMKNTFPGSDYVLLE